MLFNTLKKCENFTLDTYVASLTYICFVPAKGLIRDLLAQKYAWTLICGADIICSEERTVL